MPPIPCSHLSLDQTLASPGLVQPPPPPPLEYLLLEDSGSSASTVFSVPDFDWYLSSVTGDCYSRKTLRHLAKSMTFSFPFS